MILIKQFSVHQTSQTHSYFGTSHSTDILINGKMSQSYIGMASLHFWGNLQNLKTDAKPCVCVCNKTKSTLRKYGQFRGKKTSKTTNTTLTATILSRQDMA